MLTCLSIQVHSAGGWQAEIGNIRKCLGLSVSADATFTVASVSMSSRCKQLMLRDPTKAHALLGRNTNIKRCTMYGC